MASSFLRARQLCPSARRRAIYFYGISSALLIPALVWIFGVMVKSILDRELAPEAEAVPWFTQQVAGVTLSWPTTTNPHLALFFVALTFAGVLGVYLFLSWRLNRAVQLAALATTTAIHQRFRQHLFKTGDSELLGVRNEQIERLITEDVEQLRNTLIVWWRTMPHAFIVCASLFVLGLVTHVWLTLLAVLCAIFVWQRWRRMERHAVMKGHYWRVAADHQQSMMMEMLDFIPLFSSYQLDRFPGTSFERLASDYQQAAGEANNSRSAVMPWIYCYSLLAVTVSLLIVGLSENLSFAEATTVLASMVGLWFSWKSLTGVWEKRDVISRSGESIWQYLERDASIIEVPRPIPLDMETPNIFFDRVTYADDEGARILDEVTLDIEAGTTTAIVSLDDRLPKTLGALVLRSIDPAAGRVLINDIDIALTRIEPLRTHGCWVPDAHHVFPGTVTDNIGCGDPSYTQFDIIEAAKQARAYNFVHDLPRGFSTSVGLGGEPLTEGQAFRLALARALLRDPSLLVIGEPKEEMDRDSQGHIDVAIRNASRGRTIIVMPTRLETLRRADRVLVFEKGRLVGDGTHADLLRTSEIYRHVNYVQFGAHRDRQSHRPRKKNSRERTM